MSRNTLFSTRLRRRRLDREFDRALRAASPAMRQELLAAAARSGLTIR